MNLIAQNALLKALEEPSASTHFLLVSSRPHSLLPTIRSRCQTLMVPRPPQDVALRWLREQGIDQPEAALAAAAGAPLAATEAAQWETSKGALIGQLSKPSFDIIGLAQACEAFEPALVIAWLQRWTYDILHVRATGTVRYHPGMEKTLEDIGRGRSDVKLAGYLRHLAQARALARHPLNPKLFFEGLFLEYLTALKPAGAR
jgi:DNA polymerase-3 subunit delta'